MALKFILVAHTGRPGWTVFLIRVVAAVKNTITMIYVANTLILTGTFELRSSAINYTTILIRSVNTVLVPITDISQVNTPMVRAMKLTRQACRCKVAVLLIRSIPTVIICVTDPVEGDAEVIITGEVRCRAGGEFMGGAVLLITAIHTVTVLVTAPVSRDALSSQVTGEC